MTKKEAIRIIVQSANLYRTNLENQTILFVYKENYKIKYIEMIFLPSNFLHFTGINIINSDIHSSVQFYSLCLNNKLRVNDFNFKSNGTSILKLQILPQIMQLHKNAKMIGKYDNSKIYLLTDVLIGSSNMCIGAKKKADYYIPNTVLKEDIRKIVSNYFKIIGILKKDTKELKYRNFTYVNSLYKEQIMELLEKQNIFSRK